MIWDLNDVTLINSDNISSITSNPTGIRFSADGSILFVSDHIAKTIISASLPTPYVISGYSIIYRYSPGFVGRPYDFTFSKDGLKLILAYLGSVFSLSLSTAWDLSTASLHSYNSLRGTVDDSHGIDINSSGTVLYVADYNQALIWQIPLTTAWDLYTADTASAESFTLSSTGSLSVFLGDDYNSLFILNKSEQILRHWEMSTPGDITSCGNIISSLDTSSYDSECRGITFNSEGTVLYAIGNSGNKIGTFSLEKISPTFIPRVSII